MKFRPAGHSPAGSFHFPVPIERRKISEPRCDASRHGAHHHFRILPSRSRADLRGTKSSLHNVKLSSIQPAVRATECRAFARAACDRSQRTLPSLQMTRAVGLPGGVMLPPSVVDTSRRGSLWPLLLAAIRANDVRCASSSRDCGRSFDLTAATVTYEFVLLIRSVKCQIMQCTKCALHD